MHAPHNSRRRARGRRLVTLLALAVATTGLSTASVVVEMAATAPPAHAAVYLGSPARLALAKPIVDFAATPSGRGYWLVATDGGIFSYGDARFYGSTGNIRLNKPIVGMAATKSGKGYWLVASDGGIFTFGDARFYGSTGHIRLNKPIVGMSPTKTGRGYWLVASDGGIFSFGDARFFGSTGHIRLNKPIVGMARTPSGNGYWMVATDGGIFRFGDAKFYGSTGDRRLANPIVGMTARNDGKGYWLLAADGAVFNFGAAKFYGSAAGALAGQRAVGLDATPSNDGYWIASQWGGVDTASASGLKMDPNLKPRTGEAAIAQELVQRINAERGARGRHAVFVDPYITAHATAHANYLRASGKFHHSDLGRLLNNSGGRFNAVGENLFKGGGGGATDAGTAHVALMNSQGHRDNLLLPEFRLVGIGVACYANTLIVVEGFAVPSGVNLGSHGKTPLNPIAAPNQDGSHC